ncbi:MAG: hypothetical protein ACI4NE_08055 [Succinivibrio sp.]
MTGIKDFPDLPLGGLIRAPTIAAHQAQLTDDCIKKVGFTDSDKESDKECAKQPNIVNYYKFDEPVVDDSGVETTQNESLPETAIKV